MKTNKNTHNRTSKTTFKAIISNLNRWYGNQWKISGLIMAGIFTLAVVIPGIFG